MSMLLNFSLTNKMSYIGFGFFNMNIFFTSLFPIFRPFILLSVKNFQEIWLKTIEHSWFCLMILQAIPSMLLALVLCFDHQKGRNSTIGLDALPSKGFKYFWHALAGYAVGLFTALAAGILTRSPQPALLYLVNLLISHSFLFLFSFRRKL